jgi:hypothetical protein
MTFNIGLIKGKIVHGKLLTTCRTSSSGFGSPADMLDQLLNYAKSANPERDIPSSIRLVHDRHTLTVFDLYPKGEEVPLHRT